MSKPKVSVIVNFYNSEEYVEQCLCSLINQTLKEIEIVVVDDGSTDKTLDIARKIALQDSRIHVIHKDNGGLAHARKTGMEYSNGEYISFVDGDDWVKNNMYETMYIAAEKHDLDIVQVNFEPNGDYDKWKMVESEKKYNSETITGEDFLNMYLRRDIMPALWQRIFRNGLWKPEEFKVRSKVMSDHYNFPEWASRAKKVQIIDEAYYVWLTRNGSLGRPQGDIEDLNAKSRFLSGISILDFSDICNEKYRDNIVFYLFSYMTQTALHLSRGNLSGFNMVYDLWDNLIDDIKVEDILFSLAPPECLSRFFSYLLHDRDRFENYVVSGNFIQESDYFIKECTYNGSDMFE